MPGCRQFGAGGDRTPESGNVANVMVGRQKQDQSVGTIGVFHDLGGNGGNSRRVASERLDDIVRRRNAQRIQLAACQFVLAFIENDHGRRERIVRFATGYPHHGLLNQGHLGDERVQLFRTGRARERP